MSEKLLEYECGFTVWFVKDVTEEDIKDFQYAIDCYPDSFFEFGDWPSITSWDITSCKALDNDKGEKEFRVEFILELQDESELSDLKKTFDHHSEWLVDLNKWDKVRMVYDGKFEPLK